MDIFNRFSMLFSTPSEAFHGLNEKPLSGRNIAIGFLTAAILTLVFSYWSASDPVLKQEIISQRMIEIDKQLMKKEITAEQAEFNKKIVSASIEKDGEMWTSVGYTLNFCLIFFLSSFYYYIIGSFVSTTGKFPFASSMSMISILSILTGIKVIVTNSLQIALGNLHSSLGIILLINNYNSDNWLHQLFSSLDVFTAAYYYFLIVGFKVSAKTSWLSSILAVMIPYLIILGFSMYVSAR